MGNIITVARKEFSDLVNSKLVLVIIIWYVIQFLIVIYDNVYPFGGMPSVISHYVNPAEGFFDNFAYMLCENGSIVGIVFGFVSIAAEVDGNALSILLVKPLYRDTVINGKLLGIIGFILCLFAFTSFLYLAAISLYSIIALNAPGPLLSLYIPTFIGYLPLVLMLSLLCILLMYSITLLMCLLFKNQSMALFLSLLIWVVLFVVIGNVLFAGNIGFFAGSDVQDLIGSFSPSIMLYYILSEHDILGVLTHWGPQLFMLYLYCFIAIVLAYIAFLRRDVA